MEANTMKAAARRFLKKRVWIGLALLIVIVGFAVYTRNVMIPEPISDIFKILEDQGYSVNVGFSGAFGPGNVVQVLLYWEGQLATDVPGDDTIKDAGSLPYVVTTVQSG